MNREPKKPGYAYVKPDTREATQPSPPPAPTPTERALAREKTRRRSRPVLVVLLSLLLVALGAAAALFIYDMYQSDEPASTNQPAQATENTTKTKLTAKEVMAAIAKDGYENSDDEFLVQPIKVAGYNFFTLAEASEVRSKKVAYNESSIEAANIAKELKNRDFTEKIVQTGNDESMYVANYAHTDVVCRVTTTKTYNNPTGDHQIVIGCEDMAAINTLAQEHKTYYDAMPDDTRNIPNMGIARKPVIKDSKTEGYRTTTLTIGSIVDGEAGMGSAAYLFYQTPDEKWHFFTATQQVIGCDRYNTTDLKKAYLGDSCYDQAVAKESTVKL